MPCFLGENQFINLNTIFRNLTGKNLKLRANLILRFSACIYICRVYFKPRQNIFVFTSKSGVLIFIYIM